MRRTVQHIHPYDLYALLKDSPAEPRRTNEFVQITVTGVTEKYTQFSEIMIINDGHYAEDTGVPVRTEGGKDLVASAQ